MAKNYRSEPETGGQKKLIIILIVLAVIGGFVGFIYPGIWLSH